MTTDRLDRIEALLATVAEQQAQNTQDIAATRAITDRNAQDIAATRAIADSNARAIQALGQHVEARMKDDREQTIVVELDIISELRETRQELAAMRSAINTLARGMANLTREIGWLWRRDTG